MQKHVNLVDLVKSFPTNIYLQNLASIQKRTSPVKFAHLAEKSEIGSISNLSTKVSSSSQLETPLVQLIHETFDTLDFENFSSVKLVVREDNISKCCDLHWSTFSFRGFSCQPYCL